MKKLQWLFCLILLLVAAMSALAQEGQASLCVVKTYTVKHNDRLIPISLKHFGGEDYKKLALWSGIKDPNKIWPGDIVRNSCPKVAARVFCCTPDSFSGVKLVPEIESPEISFGNQETSVVAIPAIFNTNVVTKFDFNVAPAPKDSEKVVTAVLDTQLSASEAEQMLPALAVMSESVVPKKTMYKVFVHVPEGMARGIHDGLLPMMFAEGETKKGEWRSLSKTSVQIEKGEIQGVTIYEMCFVFPKKPEPNALAEIDFQNGNIFSVPGKFLVAGEIVKVPVSDLPPNFEKKVYKTLSTMLPKKPNWSMVALRPAVQLGPRIGFAVLTANPVALGYIASEFALSKMKQPRANVTATVRSQNAEIEMLKKQVAYLLSLQQNQSNSQLAQTARKD